MTGPIPYQIISAIPGKRYVCEMGLSSRMPVALHDRRLAGPFENQAEADAASGAIEAEHSYYQARTDVWLCSTADTEPFLAVLALSRPAVGPAAALSQH